VNDLEACLPETLRGTATTITRVGAGLSGAGVFRVDAGGRAFVLKVSDDGEGFADWRRKVQIRRDAAEAGLAPAVVHVDEERRAVLSAFVEDRSFAAFYANTATREAAVLQLGRTLRRVHALPLPAGANDRTARAFLADMWAEVRDGLPLPTFVEQTVQRALASEVPPTDRPAVLSHNDVNPSNVIYDGEHLLLLDWETAGRNDPLFDLATVSLFLRMDEATCQRLLAAYDDAPVAPIPAGLAYYRRMVAAMCGAGLLRVARINGHAGDAGADALTLDEFYQRMWAGTIKVASADGQWAFGLALMKTSVAL
jgi:aminoglycoside phosphotransferase (APT) family kinase protein